MTIIGGALTLNDALHIDSPFESGAYATGETVVGGLITTGAFALIGAVFLLLTLRRATGHRRD